MIKEHSDEVGNVSCCSKLKPQKKPLLSKYSSHYEKKKELLLSSEIFIKIYSVSL